MKINGVSPEDHNKNFQRKAREDQELHARIRADIKANNAKEEDTNKEVNGDK